MLENEIKKIIDELKKKARNKAIDEFLERLMDAENFSELPDGTRTTAVEMCEVEAIAEELKSDRVDTYK